jgi:hypothetical protein
MVRKLVSLPHVLLAAIEDYRFKSRTKTESEAIRRLLEFGLASAGKPLEATAIDLHLSRDRQTALLAVRGETESGFEILISTQGLKDFLDLIDQKLKSIGLVLPS